jgi:hypothetical protein
MSAREETAPFLASAYGHQPETGKLAIAYGLYFARSQAEAMGMVINDYRGRFSRADGFGEPIASASALSDEQCAPIAKYHARKRLPECIAAEGAGQKGGDR